MSNWATRLVDDILPPITLEIGKRYVHPDDGVIEVTSGCYRHPASGRISNFWYWTLVGSGEEKHGYGGYWPEVIG